MTKTTRLSILLIPLVMVLDALSKWWVRQALNPGESIAIGGDWLRVTRRYNSGMAFGLFQGAGRDWSYLIGPIILGLAVWFFYVLQTTQSVAWPLGLILSGALANLIDRVADGRVLDLLDLAMGPVRWPTFNVADAAITVGLALLTVIVARAEQADAINDHTLDRGNRPKGNG